MKAKLTWMLVLGLALAAVGCGGGGGGGGGGGSSKTPVPFSYRTIDDLPVMMRLVDENGPVAHAVVQIIDPTPFPLPDGDLEDVMQGLHFFHGLSDSNGYVRGSARIPTRFSEVDLIVDAPGYTGEWTHLELLERFGPFAPSSRSTVTVPELESLVLTLEATKGEAE